jgi:WhiB family redox-sensing transcriptional regulator
MPPPQFTMPPPVTMPPPSAGPRPPGLPADTLTLLAKTPTDRRLRFGAEDLHEISESAAHRPCPPGCAGPTPSSPGFPAVARDNVFNITGRELLSNSQECVNLSGGSNQRRVTRAHSSSNPKEYSMDWRHAAACLDEDPELFFPVGNTGPALLQIEEAKAVCARCDVAPSCLEWAINNNQDSGVWGGLSEDERRSLKRRNARARRAA